MKEERGRGAPLCPEQSQDGCTWNPGTGIGG